MQCTHLAQIKTEIIPSGTGCKECLELGLNWIKLRECLSCGHVGCCDSSQGMHATAHYNQTQHAIMQSAEGGEDWRWCYVDKAIV